MMKKSRSKVLVATVLFIFSLLKGILSEQIDVPIQLGVRAGNLIDVVLLKFDSEAPKSEKVGALTFYIFSNIKVSDGSDGKKSYSADKNKFQFRNYVVNGSFSFKGNNDDDGVKDFMKDINNNSFSRIGNGGSRKHFYAVIDSMNKQEPKFIFVERLFMSRSKNTRSYLVYFEIPVNFEEDGKDQEISYCFVTINSSNGESGIFSVILDGDFKNFITTREKESNKTFRSIMTTLIIIFVLIAISIICCCLHCCGVFGSKGG